MIITYCLCTIYMYHKRFERNGYSPFWYTCDFVKWFILMTIDQLSPYEIVMWIIEWCFHEKFLNSPLWNNSKSTDIYRYVWFYYIKLNLWLKLLRKILVIAVRIFSYSIARMLWIRNEMISSDVMKRNIPATLIFLERRCKNGRR